LKAKGFGHPIKHEGNICFLSCCCYSDFAASFGHKTKIEVIDLGERGVSKRNYVPDEIMSILCVRKKEGLLPPGIERICRKLYAHARQPINGNKTKKDILTKKSLVILAQSV